MGESGARMKIWNAMNFALPMTGVGREEGFVVVAGVRRSGI